LPIVDLNGKLVEEYEIQNYFARRGFGASPDGEFFSYTYGDVNAINIKTKKISSFSLSKLNICKHSMHACAAAWGKPPVR